MKLKKFLAAALSLTLTLSLAACGGDNGADDTASPSASGSAGPSSSSSASPSPSASSNVDLSVIEDPYVEQAQAYTQEIAGLDRDAVMLTVNGVEVTAEQYLYWLTYDCYYWDYMNYMYYGAYLDFTAAATDELTVAEYLKEDARGFAVYYSILEQQAAANGCGVTDAQAADWTLQKAEYVETNGAEAFELLMAQYGMSKDAFDTLNTYSHLYTNLMDALVAEPTGDDLAAYIEENEIYAAKHILIRTAVEDDEGNVTFATGDAITNEDGSAYTGTAEEYNAGALARAQDLLDQLNAAEDPVALFDELMNGHSEDPGLASYPDGYTFTTGEMVAEFEEGTKALEYNEISGLVKAESTGYHIILRLEPDVADSYSTTKMDAMMEQWMDEAEIVTTEAYDNLDVKAVYDNYVLYQNDLVAEDTETDPSTGNDSGE